MKLIKKICIGLTASVLTLSPLLSSSNNMQTVQASKKSTNSKKRIFLIYDAYVYNKLGHKIKGNTTKSFPYIELDPNNYMRILSFNDNIFYNHGTKKIHGQTYYNIGHGHYLNAGDVYKANGKNTKKGKLVLNHQSSVYTKNGKKTGQALAKKAVVKYRGKVKIAKSNFAPKYYYLNRSRKTCYLPTTDIKGKQYYSIGRNRYIRAYNVGSINGCYAVYRGTTYAKMLTKTTTTMVSGVKTKHKLKKGQKVKVDLMVIPPYDDFEGYYLRLYDYPNEYINEYDVNLRNYLPNIDYHDAAFTYVKPVTSENIKLYNFAGQRIARNIENKQKEITVDGLFYLWLPEEKKAEPFYHYLDFDSGFINNDGSVPTLTLVDPQTKKEKIDTEELILEKNSFIRASDVNYTHGIKLKPVITAKQAKLDQSIATNADKKKLQTLFLEGQKNENRSVQINYRLRSYSAAIIIASKVLQSNSATIAQVKEAVWLLETTKLQLTAFAFPESD